jgi:hypothetical protein
MHRLPNDQTLLISGLFHPKRPEDTFSIRVATDPPGDRYTFVQLPAQSFMAVNAYDGYFAEQSKKGMVTHQPIRYAMPALRANNAFTDDFVEYWQKWMTETGEEPPNRHPHETTDYYSNTFTIGSISHSLNRIHYTNGYHRTRMFYLFSAEKIPLFVETRSLSKLEDRLADVEERIESGKNLFSFDDVVKDFMQLKFPRRWDQLKENMHMLTKFVTAQKPEDMFLQDYEFRPKRLIAPV